MVTLPTKIKYCVGEILRKIRPEYFYYLSDISRSERIAEYTWVLRNLDVNKCDILDVGCFGTFFPIALATQGHRVIGLDLSDYGPRHPNFKFIRCEGLSNKSRR